MRTEFTAFAAVFAAAVLAHGTCITDGWPVAGSEVSANAVSSTAMSLGAATGGTRSGDGDFEFVRLTRLESAGGNVDARDFCPGLYIMFR